MQQVENELDSQMSLILDELFTHTKTLRTHTLKLSTNSTRSPLTMKRTHILQVQMTSHWAIYTQTLNTLYYTRITLSTQSKQNYYKGILKEQNKQLTLTLSFDFDFAF